LHHWASGGREAVLRTEWDAVHVAVKPTQELTIEQLSDRHTALRLAVAADDVTKWRFLCCSYETLDFLRNDLGYQLAVSKFISADLERK
jgi:hypothetical protein